MLEEAQELYRLHGDAAVELLKRRIANALAEEDDAGALHLNGLLVEIEGIVAAAGANSISKAKEKRPN